MNTKPKRNHTEKALAQSLHTTATTSSLGQVVVVPHSNIPGSYFVTCTNATKQADKLGSGGFGGFGTYKTLKGAKRRAGKEFSSAKK